MKIITIIIFLSFIHPLQAKIYSRIQKDGTIEYYSKPYSPRAKKHWFPTTYDTLIFKYARKHKVDPYLIKCIIKVESNFTPDAVSISGAMGLMQLMQNTAEYYTNENPMNPDVNLRVGIRHFAMLLRYFKNQIPLALAAYHAGIGRVKKRMKVPPIRTTINYVNKIMFLYTGKRNYKKDVQRIYKKIQKDGTILFYN